MSFFNQFLTHFFMGNHFYAICLLHSYRIGGAFHKLKLHARIYREELWRILSKFCDVHGVCVTFICDVTLAYLVSYWFQATAL